MVRVLFVLAFLVMLLGLCDLADAKCGGGGGGRGRMAERRAMRRGGMMSYGYTTTFMQAPMMRGSCQTPMIMQAPACQSCAPAQLPAQAPPTKK